MKSVGSILQHIYFSLAILNIFTQGSSVNKKLFCKEDLCFFAICNGIYFLVKHTASESYSLLIRFLAGFDLSGH